MSDAPAADPAALLGRCEDLVRLALRLGAQQAEAYWSAGGELEVELENGRLSCTSQTEDQGGAVRVLHDGRVGFAYLTDPQQGRQAIEQALRNARLAPAKGYALPQGLPPARLPDRWNGDVATLDVEAALRLSEDLLRGAQEGCPDAVVAGGGAGFGWGAEAIASSEGVACHDRSTAVHVGAGLVLGESGAAVSHHDQAVAHAPTVDAFALGRETATTLASLPGPKPLGKGGRHDVLFHADAVAELLGDLVVSAVIGDDAMRGKTVWAGRLGATVGPDLLTIADDPLHPLAVGASPFDAEGLPSRRVPIVADGVLRTYLFDSWTAHEHKAQRTHSAVRGGFKGRPETGAHHFVVEGRGARPWDDLVGSIDDGLVVGSVLGAHTANPTTGEFSITAPNVWRVRGGEVVGPCKEVALAGSLDALLTSLDGVGDTPKVLDGATLPPLLFRDVDVAV